MRSRLLGLAVACFVSVGVAGCKKGSSTPTTPSPGGGGSSSVSITIPAGDGYGNASSFSPGATPIAVGGTVTWSNRDTFAHTTTSDTNLWSGDLPAGGSYSRQFSARGTFTYKCLVHPGMTGTINVQ